MSEGSPYSWREFPNGGSGNGCWSAFRSNAYEELLTLIQQADRDFPNDPHGRLERVRQLRREHHLIVIADRVRRSLESPEELSGKELRKAAEFILDRNAYIAANGEGSAEPRSHSEENMTVAARVNWHKLMRRAGSRPELRGGWGSPKAIRGNAAILKKISAPGLRPETRAAILRKHIEEKVEQLLEVARELVVVKGCKLPRQDRLIVRELEGLLVRTQWPRRDKRPIDETPRKRSDLRSALRRPPPVDEDQ